MDEARKIAQQWWTATEVDRTFPNDAATQQVLAWLQQQGLTNSGPPPGRPRLTASRRRLFCFVRAEGDCFVYATKRGYSDACG